MLILLYGPDSYRRGQKLKELIAEYEKKHSALTVARFDLEDESRFDELKTFSESQSLFDKTKLGIVHNPEEAGKDAAELYKNLLEDKSTTLILIADKNPTSDFKFLLKKPSLAQEFGELKGAQLTAFIKKEAETRGVKLPTSHIPLLTSTLGGDTWALVNELEKISLGGALEAGFAMPEFFPLIQRIKSRSAVEYKLPALTCLLENEEPAAVFNITASLVSGELKTKMADYDIAIKSGKLEYDEALLDLVLGAQ